MSEKNEWVKIDNGIATVGLTKEALKQFGEIVYVELPDIGKEAIENEPICVIESTKTASDILSPVTGKVIEVNLSIKTNMTIINENPESDGWLYKVELR